MSVSINNVDKSMERDVWCILGLPFDAVNMNQVVKKVQVAAENKTPCFISTPNLNFLIESQNDDSFRDSVINSDLSVADGKPLVWIAKLLNIPIPERVAGSDLIEELIRNESANRVLKVFFFGGEDGIAEIACEKLNSHVTGLKCVGYLNPGFGSIDDMSSNEIVNEINQGKADFIIVSLGAKKGQVWIERNIKELNAPIISHLGAVVNFIAGTINRAPKIFQKLGLEWLWRIKEEPSLWKRYFHDAVSFFNLLAYRVFPLFILVRIIDKKSRKNKYSIVVTSNTDGVAIELRGYCGSDNIAEINNAFEGAINSLGDVDIIIRKDTYIDAAFIAKTLLLKNILLNKDRKLLITSESKLVTKLFYYNCCEYLLK